MSDLRRRKLGDNRNRGQQQQRTQGTPTNTGNRQPAQGQTSPPAQPGRPQRHGRNQATGGLQQGQPQGQQQNRNPNQRNRNQGQQQQQRGRPQQRPQRAPAPPPPPPAYMQRDLLLVATGETTLGIEQIRAKFDPLAKKVPIHITLLEPEPAKSITSEFLKSLGAQDLPTLGALTFSNVTVHDEMYLWLIPDDEGREKLLKWRESLLGLLTAQTPQHSQGQEYIPHLTLGYVPRSLTPEDAVTFVRNIISFPMMVNFDKLILEEFSENQVSTSVDSFPLAK